MRSLQATLDEAVRPLLFLLASLHLLVTPLKKDKRINLRLSQKDYHQIQLRAIEEGIPYQTLIASIVHKYLNGLLLPKHHEKDMEKRAAQAAVQTS